MRLAITGKRKLGKSTLARHMQEEYGWGWINYTGMLKEWLVDDINNRRMPFGMDYLEVETLEREKETYRHLLQQYGVLVGFDEGNGVRRAVYQWEQHRLGPTEDVIFDNVRFQAQYDILKDYGFVLVKLTMPREGDSILHRPDLHRLAYDQMHVRRDVDTHPAENQEIRADIEISADNTVEGLADILLRLSGQVRRSAYEKVA